MNLLEEAESLILYQFRESPKLNGLIRGLVTPFNESLEQIDKLHYGRYIDRAHGYTLDVIGDIVDFKRQGKSDEEYRVWLKVAILLNNSHGTVNNVLAILRVLFGDKPPPIQMSELSPNVAEFTFFKYPDVPTKILFSIIRRAVPLTTKCSFVDSTPGEHSRENHLEANGLKDNSKQALAPFQFDVTRFDESFFADFFREGVNE